MKKDRSIFMKRCHTDVTMIFIVLFLVTFGIIMVFSSSYYDYSESATSMPLWMKQLVFAGIGFVVMMAVSYVKIEFINKFVPFIYIMMNALLGLVLLTPGKNGSSRWFEVMGISVQPSEIAKLAIILCLAFVLSAFSKHLDKWRVLIFIGALMLIPAGLIALENLSSAIIFVAICGTMVFIAHPNLLRVLGLGGLALGLMFIAYKMKSYRGGRVDTFFNGPWSDPDGLGRQTIQSLYAIGSGGFFGIGLGQSIQKMGYISEAHNDIIFAIICEELGLIGGIAVLLLFCMLIYRCWLVAKKALSTNDILIVVGVSSHIAAQVFINIAVATNIVPTTGIPLPFISYGGSSLMICLVEMGLILNVARHTVYLKRLSRNT